MAEAAGGARGARHQRLGERYAILWYMQKSTIVIVLLGILVGGVAIAGEVVPHHTEEEIHTEYEQ